MGRSGEIVHQWLKRGYNSGVEVSLFPLASQMTGVDCT